MKKRIGAALLSFAMLAALFVPSVIPARAEADNAITPVLTTTTEPTATVTAAPGETAAPTTTVTTAPGETAAPTAQPTETAAPSASPETSESPAPSATPAQCTCGAAEGEAHKEGCPLYAKPFDASSVYDSLMACATADEMDAILAALTEEQFTQFTDEQKAALEEHYQSLRGEEEPGEEEGTGEEADVGNGIVNVTDVAPFLPPVEGEQLVRRMLAAARARDAEKPDSGLELNKTATPTEDGYMIRMEAYATGETTTSTVTTEIPTDIVLVLDQSGSMAYCMQCGKEIGNDWDECQGHYVYKEAFDVNTDNKYYIKKGEEYIRVKYCDGDHFLDSNKHEESWVPAELSNYGNDHRNYIEKNKIIKPKTKAGEAENIQFYTYEKQASISRLQALKTAASSFVNAVADKAKGQDGAAGVDHRIAVVGFASTPSKKGSDDHGNNTEILSIAGSNSGKVGIRYNQLTDQNYKDSLQKMNTTAGVAMVNNAIDALAAEGATRIDLGLEMAKKVFDQNPIAAGEKRNRVVIVFTDGSPTSFNNFEEDVANNAIANAKTLKSTDYGATVYSIGIFNNANGSNPSSLPENNATNNNRENRFMHLVSSNYPNATNMNTPGTINPNLNGKSYYLSAGDTEALSNIFQQISDQINSGSTTTLDESAVIKDIVTPYFTMPANTESVTVKTADSNGSVNDWTNEQPFSGTVVVDPTNNSVSVSGFSFKDNWCGTHTENGATTFRNGKKLIIEFEVKVKDGFLGGNNVPTNGEQSGIYENSSASEPIQKFDVPTVNVPIPEITITAEDKNVYLLQTPDSDTMKEWVTKIECGTVDISAPNQIEPWQKGYVTIGELTVTADNGFDATADGTYTARLTVSPTTGDGAKTGTVTKQINVFKPELTFKDSQIDLGETANYENNKADTNFEAWKHGEMLSTDEGVTMIGTKPELTLSYNPLMAAFAQDTPVKVTVKIDDTDVNTYTTFKHDPCNFVGCKWNDLYAEGKSEHGKAHFIVHVKSFDLTIKKKGWEEIDENQSFVFKVTKNDGSFSMDVVIHGNESVTIKGLKPGTYTVTEEIGWSWRYTLVDVSQQVNPATAKEKDENDAVLVTFTNTREKIKWLNGSTWCENRWATKTATKPTDNN